MDITMVAKLGMLIVVAVIMALILVLPVYAYGYQVYTSDNCSDGIGFYSGEATSLGGTWGRTELALASGDILCIKPVRVAKVWKPSGGIGYESLNPYAKEAAKVVGYGVQPYKPSIYLTSTSRNIAKALGYCDDSIPVLHEGW